MFIILWKFQPAEGRQIEFERAYGPEGDWGGFFRAGKGFLGTELLRDPDRPGEYLTLDRWERREDYLRFRQENLEKYREIDRRCESLTREETLIGNFDTVGEGGRPK
jgi:heme-degrading monooxygenase HmoA